MISQAVISFDNTEFAFEHKTDKQLKKANFLFSLMAFLFFFDVANGRIASPSGCRSTFILQWEQRTGGHECTQSVAVLPHPKAPHSGALKS